MGELAPLTRLVSPRQTADIDVCPNTAVIGSAPTEIEFEDEPSEAVTVPRLRDPGEPTQQECDVHVITGHATFCAWCPHSVRGRERNAPHRALHRDAGAIPFISFDYCEFANREMSDVDDGAEDADSPTLVLVMHDSVGKNVFADA